MENLDQSLIFEDPKNKFLSEYLKPGELEEMTARAKTAAKLSYSPYSKFAVGACLLSKSGEYFQGTNIETCTFSLTKHAEATAVCSALLKGVKGNPLKKYNQFTKIF